jgi:stearoyl-CoA desaturase (delta-9 desaturase)
MTDGPAAPPEKPKYGWNVLPFIAFHAVAMIGIFFVPFTWEYVALAVALYYLRMFGITAGFHRYFAHRAYKTNRVFQYILAFLGTMSAQKGVLWWAGHHRDHHKYSDMPQDLHSPKQRGFWWSHAGWFLVSTHDETPLHRIRDFAKYPELLWLDRHFLVPPTALAVVVFALGGFGALVWGFFVSTVLLWHGTFLINSMAHVYGSRRYETTDTSRNSLILALLTLGEGWHNNHHCYQSSANQGFFWWELDGSYYALKVLSWLRVVSGLRKPPQRLLGRVRDFLPTKEEVLAKLPSSDEMVKQLAAAKLALELFPARIRETLHARAQASEHSLERIQEEFLTRLPEELVLRLAEVGEAIERLPEEVRTRLKDAERALERLPDELRAKLPSTEELMERLSAYELARA